MLGERARGSWWLYVLAVACGTSTPSKMKVDVPGPDSLSSDCVEATQHSDLTWIQANVFAKSCVFSSCHGPPSPVAGLDLSSVANAEASTVNVVASLCGSDTGGGSQYRVVPGNPDASWMMKMIGESPDNTPSSCPVPSNIGLMPMNQPLLCQQERDAIQRWIASGAPPQ